MTSYARSHLSDQALLCSATTHAGQEHTATAHLLADLAEIDARKLYLPAAYPSLFAFCVGELRLCEQAALKRIQAARAGRRFPAIFDAVAQGRLHLSGVVVLAPHLTEETASELLAAATHKSKAEIERLLAERFPKPDMLAWVADMPSGDVETQLSPGIVHAAPAPGSAGDRLQTKPLSSQSFAVQFTMSQSGHDHLRYAQALLGHQVPSGDIAQVIERALAVYVAHLEKRKFAATEKPRTAHRRRATTSARVIPAHVRRAVWERDQGQCTFVSESGHRCEARKRLEFDHILEVARGGEATVEGMRLRCRAHNQHTAECTFGGEFMHHKRLTAVEARASAKARAVAAAHESATADERTQAAQRGAISERAHEEAEDRDVIPWLRALGFSAAEARHAATRCEGMPDASLEERVRVALSCFRVRGTRFDRVGCAWAGR